jgi:hypothetical protein
VGGLLRLDDPVSVYRFCSDAKKAAAFFKNSRSKRNSAEPIADTGAALNASYPTISSFVT